MNALAEIRRLRKGRDDSRDGVAIGHGRKGELAGKSTLFRRLRSAAGLPMPEGARKLPGGQTNRLIK
ncbi:hypothetical protein CXK95_13990 [Stutzerimonas degradans]|uniref:Uncharacterized protein n=2 Tax=Stutzerimonas degradans TaxID=2968968 RepID=A0A8E2QCL6_9GAMM|nr:hypothetical protein CXK95_13990 [Stutzerimonas degradans]QPT23581.1 hypothetical protein I6G33_12715 [Stutzerimonas degradans]